MLLTILGPYLSSIFSIFIAINAFGKIPSFLLLTEHYSHKQIKRIAWQSLFYACAAILLIVFAAKLFFFAIGITSPDIKIAGGIVLLGLSLNVLVRGAIEPAPQAKKLFPDLGIFPVVTSLIACPELVTLSFINATNFGILIFAASLILNMAFVWLVLENADVIMKAIGEKGTVFLSKFAEIILCAIAATALRQGIAEIAFH